MRVVKAWRLLLAKQAEAVAIGVLGFDSFVQLLDCARGAGLVGDGLKLAVELLDFVVGQIF